MFDIVVDTAKVSKLQDKFKKYPPFALKKGLEAGASFLNSSDFKSSMYPTNRNGSPFTWSSDKQRRYVFATVDLPYRRTDELARSGEFVIDEKYYTIGYTNSAPFWQYVLHPSMQIIGHRLRGWIPVNTQVQKKAGQIVPKFKEAVLAAWEEYDKFLFGGGAGL